MKKKKKKIKSSGLGIGVYPGMIYPPCNVLKWPVTVYKSPPDDKREDLCLWPGSDGSLSNQGNILYIVCSPSQAALWWTWCHMAHGMPRICHCLWWWLWHCFALSSGGLRGHLGKPGLCLFVMIPIHNGSIIQNKRRPSKRLSLLLHRIQHSISELQRDGWRELEIRNGELQDSLILAGCKVASIYWIVGSLKTSSGLCLHAVCRHIKLDCCFFKPLYDISQLPYDLCFLQFTFAFWGGEFLWEAPGKSCISWLLWMEELYVSLWAC